MYPCKSVKKQQPLFIKLSQVVIFVWLYAIISVKLVDTTKCYVCAFHLAYCTSPLDCYNQPDICSNTNFSPLLSQVDECPFGCEQYIKTDATGALVLWRRGCATEGSPKSSYICYSRIIYFQRHEQCWCQADYCNSSTSPSMNNYLMYASLIIMMALVLF